MGWHERGIGTRTTLLQRLASRADRLHSRGGIAVWAFCVGQDRLDVLRIEPSVLRDEPPAQESNDSYGSKDDTSLRVRRVKTSAGEMKKRSELT